MLLYHLLYPTCYHQPGKFVSPCITVHHRGHHLPGRCRRLPMTIAHHTQDQIKRNHPQTFALIFYFPNMWKVF